MYWRKKWTFLNSTEYEFSYKGNYGAKGEKRAARIKKTPEQIAKQNETNKRNYVRRLIKANFYKGDYWITLKYPKGTRKPLEEVKRDMRNFLTSLRKAYRKRDHDLKYIYRIEVGKRGGIHIHIIINRIRGDTPTDTLVEKYWKHGRPNFTLLYEEGGYDELAAYITKPPVDRDDEEAEKAKAYVPSRNLTKPECERKTYFRRTVRKLVEEGPEPAEGYYIDRDSVVKGTNTFTGLSYMRYTEVRIKPMERGDSS